MKKIIVVLFLTVAALGWETTTHRAIDKVAIEKSKENGNLKRFLFATQVGALKYDKEIFETYRIQGHKVTYFEYIEDIENKNSDAISNWNQRFNDRDYQDLIEAGTMLEDAAWPNLPLWGANGRFLNHFYDPQNGGKGLRILGVQF